MIIKKDPDSINSYFEDSSNLKGGHADRVLLPQTIEELSCALREANSGRIPVTISGGGTSTTGSRIPFGGIVVSMENFNKIAAISKPEMRCTVGSGVRVEDLKEASSKNDLFYTSHPTEKAALIGGTIATNASGARSFRYGPTRRYVDRLKIVLASGEVAQIRRGDRTLTRNDSIMKLDGGSRIQIPLPTYKMPSVKSSAGYFAYDGMDLIDLFIGQEGTLSAIVEADIRLVKAPSSIFSAFVFFKKEEDAWTFAGEARRVSRKSPDMSGTAGVDALSIEYFDRNALELLRAKNSNIPAASAAAIYFEQEADDITRDGIATCWMELMARHNASADDTWVAMNESESEKFAEFRYAIPESVNEIFRKNGFPKISTDIAVPEDNFYKMAAYYTNRLREEGLGHVIFGHIGECHLHVNILPRTNREFSRSKEVALDFVRKGVSLGGTVSAEHGIGKLKHRYLEEMYGRSGILEMAGIKKAFDPNCILGLDNIFPKEILSHGG